MADIHVKFGKFLSKEEGSYQFAVELDGQDSFFSLTLSRVSRNLLLGLNQLPHNRLVPRPWRGKVPIFSWTSTNGKSFSLNETHEDIPPIEEMRYYDTWRELLGAALSERDR